MGYSRMGLFYKDILRVEEAIRCVLAVLYLSENLVLVYLIGSLSNSLPKCFWIGVVNCVIILGLGGIVILWATCEWDT